MYKTVIRPIVTYACETWILTRKDELNNYIGENGFQKNLWAYMPKGVL